jgi:hypothetical protein
MQSLEGAPLNADVAIHVGRVLAWDGSVAEVEIRVDGNQQAVPGATLGGSVSTVEVNDIVVVDGALTGRPVITEVRSDYEYAEAQ